MTELVRFIFSTIANELEVPLASGIAVEITSRAKFVRESNCFGIMVEAEIRQDRENIEIIFKIFDFHEHRDFVVFVDLTQAIPKVRKT